MDYNKGLTDKLIASFNACWCPDKNGEPSLENKDCPFTMPYSQSTPVILAFEASANHVSSAVYANDCLVAIQQAESRFGQAAGLVSLAVNALKESGIDFMELTHVAAGRGPGSFTGIRVALAAAKGVCLAYNLPSIGVSGMEATTFSYSQAENISPILSLADTRRGNVYAQGFTTNMMQQGKIFEAQIDQLPFLVSPSICVDGLVLLGHDSLEAADAFAAQGIKTKPVIYGDNGCSTFVVDAGMIAKLAAHQIMLGLSSPLTPLYLADARLGPKKKKLAK